MAEPLGLRLAEPSGMAPSKKVTEPEGTEPDEVTVAERVTELSASAGLGEAMRTVEVGWPAMT